MSNWKGKSVGIAVNPDGMTFALTYELTDGKEVIQKTEPLVSNADSIEQIIDQGEREKNRVDAQRAAIAALDPALYANVSLDDLKARKQPPPASQDELDRQAWFALKADWQKKLKIVESGLSKTVTQADVDTAYAAMKAAYKEEYGAFL